MKRTQMMKGMKKKMMNNMKIKIDYCRFDIFFIKMTQPSNSPMPPAFMTQAGYERALEQFELDRQRWKRVEEKMKRQHEEMVADWKRKDEEYAQVISETNEKIDRDHAEIKKYSQQEIDEAVRQIRIDRLKNLLNPYVY